MARQGGGPRHSKSYRSVCANNSVSFPNARSACGWLYTGLSGTVQL